MSAIGSEMFIGSLPARLRDAGQLAEERALPEADPAQGEAPHVGACPSADVAAVVAADLELRGPARLGDHRFLGHLCSSPRLRGEGHAEKLEQALRLLVGLRRRHDADLQPAETVHLVVFDLRERELLAQSQRVIAAAVERAAGDAAEVADPGQRERREPVQEVPHPLAPERDLRADRVARPKPELGDRALGLRDDRLLAGDQREIAERGIERLRVRQRLTQADVHDALVELRDLHRVAVFELLLERRHDLGHVALAQAARHDFTSSCSPQWRQTRTRRPFSRTLWAIRVGRSQWVQTSMTLPIGSGWARSRMPPCWTFGIRSVAPALWRGFVWRFATLI